MTQGGQLIEVKFGFWPEERTLKWSGGCVEPLANHQQIVAQVRSLPQIRKGWCEAGEESFNLDSTHIAKLDANVFDDDGANFMIALIGMLRGLRLQRDGWQHLKRTPVETQKLSDFIPTFSEMEKTLEIATVFWKQATKPEVRKLAFGALHWYLFAQTYKHDFEKFNAQYTALDACYKFAQESQPGFLDAKTHNDRTRMMCWQLGVPVPEWANSVKSKTNNKQEVQIAVHRNALVHEAMFAGQPFGFAVLDECHAMTMELTGLVARLFLRLIGVENEYTRSGCQSGQMYGFSFP